MPRPKNEKLFKRITAEVFAQLLTRGISATSYASVAKACGTTRAIVQDYYPRKSDMVAAFSETANDAAMRAARPFAQRLALDDEALRAVACLFLAGSVFFEYMQANHGRSSFLAELLRDRDQGQALMFMVMDLSFQEIDRPDIVEDPAYRNDLVASIGGFFELFYDHLKRGERFDPTLYFGRMTRIWMRTAGFTEAQAALVLGQCSGALDDVTAMTAIMDRELATALDCRDA